MLPTRRTAVLVLALAVLTSGIPACGRTIPGRASAAEPAPPPATAATAAPQVPPGDTAAITGTLQAFWRAAFPAAFGRPWRDIREFVPVHARDAGAPPPPCVGRATDLSGQAFYCPAADAVVWDADGLLPDLLARHGPGGPLVVLAHEVGHAVQTRLGIDEAQLADPARYPTILLEAMSDCYAGVALAHLTRYPVAGVPFGAAERDAALRALVGFRDPLGIEAKDESAHGNAFDRVAAFQDGYAGDAARCAAMNLENQQFTQRHFGSAADQARRGNLPLPALLVAVELDARGWFGAVGGARAPGWTAPPLRPSPTGACPNGELDAQGPAAFCAADGSISVDATAMGALHDELGDYADAVLVASRYGLAVLAAAGRRTSGATAGDAAACLAGAYTGRLIDPTGGFSLSPGDLDESVQVLLTDTWAVRDARGHVQDGRPGFDRIARFRAGLQGGPDGCIPPA